MDLGKQQTALDGGEQCEGKGVGISIGGRSPESAGSDRVETA